MLRKKKKMRTKMMGTICDGVDEKLILLNEKTLSRLPDGNNFSFFLFSLS